MVLSTIRSCWNERSWKKAQNLALVREKGTFIQPKVMEKGLSFRKSQGKYFFLSAGNPALGYSKKVIRG